MKEVQNLVNEINKNIELRKLRIEKLLQAEDKIKDFKVDVIIAVTNAGFNILNKEKDVSIYSLIDDKYDDVISLSLNLDFADKKSKYIDFEGYNKKGEPINRPKLEKLKEKIENKLNENLKNKNIQTSVNLFSLENVSKYPNKTNRIFVEFKQFFD